MLKNACKQVPVGRVAKSRGIGTWLAEITDRCNSATPSGCLTCHAAHAAKFGGRIACSAEHRRQAAAANAAASWPHPPALADHRACDPNSAKPHVGRLSRRSPGAFAHGFVIGDGMRQCRGWTKSSFGCGNARTMLLESESFLAQALRRVSLEGLSTKAESFLCLSSLLQAQHTPPLENPGLWSSQLPSTASSYFVICLPAHAGPRHAPFGTRGTQMAGLWNRPRRGLPKSTRTCGSQRCSKPPSCQEPRSPL